MKIFSFILFSFAIIIKPSIAQQNDARTPLEIARSIGDKLIKETAFIYKLTLSKPDSIFNEVQTIDFERTFAINKPAILYAYTTLQSAQDMFMTMQVAHNDGCTIWLNGKKIYDKMTNLKLQLHFEERSIEMHDSCKLSLKKGINTLLIKSEAKYNKGCQVFIQPPPLKGAILKKGFEYPKIGLKGIENVDASVVSLTNWLMIGPFENDGVGVKLLESDLNTIPLGSIEFGKMYPGQHGLITWTIGKAEVLGDVVDAKEWGTPYNWNYHNGGVAWAMEELSELSNEKKYADYASNFCNFHLKGKSFVEYQVNELYAFNSANSLFINTPLLDFTLAPSMPFIYKLRVDQTDFINKKKYSLLIDSMMHYALYRQLRLPVTGIYTRITPKKYTTWTDDMFMGIPFLVQVSLYSNDAKVRKFFMDDAANQVIAFNKEVFDETVNLYSHAHTFGSNEKLPHWSRANGWGLWATTEVLMNLPVSDKRYPVILKHLQKHVAALSQLQDTSGLWPNVLDMKDSQKEVSGSAIFTMAIARGIRFGWLDKKKYIPILSKAWAGIKTSIEKDGTVHNICMGTMCSEDVNYYLNRPFYDNDTHGLFAVLFACIELEKLKEIKIF